MPDLKQRAEQTEQLKKLLAGIAWVILGTGFTATGLVFVTRQPKDADGWNLLIGGILVLAAGVGLVWRRLYWMIRLSNKSSNSDKSSDCDTSMK